MRKDKKKETNGKNLKDTGVYIVCSDEAMLTSLNTLLSGSGMVGIRDVDGKIHYMIDARNDAISALNKAKTLISTENKKRRTMEWNWVSETMTNREFDETITLVLTRHGFDCSLIGTQVISVLIKNVVSNNTSAGSNGAKILFDVAADMFNMSFQQVERNVRYAIKKSSFEGSRIKSVILIDYLAEEVREILSRQQLAFSTKKTAS